MNEWSAAAADANNNNNNIMNNNVGVVVRKAGLGGKAHGVEVKATEFLRRSVVKLGHNALGQVSACRLVS